MKRPLSVTIISWLFVAIGVGGFVDHARGLKIQGSIEHDMIWACGVSLIAILAGAFMLSGRNWARWLLVAWMAFHIVLSAFHALSEFAVHCVLFGVIGFFLFRPSVNAYFNRPKTAQVATPPTNP